MLELYMKQLLRSLPLFILSIFIFSFPVSAFYIQSGQDITLPKEKTFNETVIISGNTLTINSVINGDLICGGQNITINGAIKGDVLCAGQTLKINGPVDGNIRVAGQSLDFASSVSRNLFAAGQTLNVLKTAIIKGDLFAAGQDLNLSSFIGRDVLIAGEKLTLDPAAKVTGNFDYYVNPDNTATIAATNVKGKITKHLIPQKPTPDVDFSNVKKVFSISAKIISVFSILIVGLFLLLVFKPVVDLKKSPVMLFFLGFTAIFLTPILFVILLLTFVGIPLAFILLLVYLLGFFVAIPLSALAVGQLVHSNRFISLLLGSIIFVLLTLLPLVGWFFGFIFLCFGFGLYVRLLITKK